MKIDRIEDLIQGYEIPDGHLEEMFVYVYTSALVGSKLFDIYLEVSREFNDDDIDGLIGVLLAYALAEKQIAEFGTISEGEMQ